MAKFTISVDKDTCIGCEACTSTSTNFKMTEDDDPKAIPITPEVDELKLNEKDAQEVCPVDCIKIEES